MRQALPLAGIHVIELGSNVSGPYGTWILAALGADVVKVERPGGGDDTRGWGPPFWRGTATVFQAINRDKTSITVDFKDANALAALRQRLATDTDVVLQNLRPGAADKLGLGAETMTAANPALIYCNLWAFGAKGPLADRPGFDALMQAFGGIMAVTGEAGRPPVRAGVSIVDMGTGMWSAIGILAALNRRHEGGPGPASSILRCTKPPWVGRPITTPMCRLPVKHRNVTAPACAASCPIRPMTAPMVI